MKDLTEKKEKVLKEIDRATKIARSESPLLTEKHRRKAKLYRERQLGKLEAYEDISTSD